MRTQVASLGVASSSWGRSLMGGRVGVGGRLCHRVVPSERRTRSREKAVRPCLGGGGRRLRVVTVAHAAGSPPAVVLPGAAAVLGSEQEVQQGLRQGHGYFFGEEVAGAGEDDSGDVGGDLAHLVCRGGAGAVFAADREHRDGQWSFLVPALELLGGFTELEVYLDAGVPGRRVAQRVDIDVDGVLRDGVGVGVATVYRHFPTPEALMEAVAASGLEALAARAEQALDEHDPWRALAGFLDATLEAQLSDPSITAVRSAPAHLLSRTTELAAAMDAQVGRLLDRAHAAGTVRGVVSWEDLRPLMCGIAYAAQVHSDTLADRLESVRRYLGVMLNGMRA